MSVLRKNIISLNLSDDTGQYKVGKKTFTQQFSQIYFARLQVLRPLILKQLTDYSHIGRVLDVEAEVECFIVGTVFCENICRPDVFEEVESDKICTYSNEKRSKIIKKPLVVCLEDESGRIELDIANFLDYPWVTGTSIGVKGCANSAGKFLVYDIIEPGYPMLSKPYGSSYDQDPKFVALVSGLNYGKENADSSLARSYLFDVLNGAVHSNFGRSITKIIIAGNTMSNPVKISNEFKKKYGQEVSRYKVDHLYQIDREISNLSKTIGIEIMPGQDDLSTITLPQKPVPKSLFPTLSKIENVNFTTNPCLMEIESVKFLGCSGQNIEDLMRHVDSDDRLQMAEKTISWRNIAPTTPDSLFCYPFYDKDPFVLNEAPHVYFIGNQPEFETKILDGKKGSTRIILIPEFSETNQIVLVNLNDLNAIALKISP